MVCFGFEPHEKKGSTEVSGFICACHHASSGSNPKHTFYSISFIVNNLHYTFHRIVIRPINKHILFQYFFNLRK